MCGSWCIICIEVVTYRWLNPCSPSPLLDAGDHQVATQVPPKPHHQVAVALWSQAQARFPWCTGDIGISMVNWLTNMGDSYIFYTQLVCAKTTVVSVSSNRLPFLSWHIYIYIIYKKVVLYLDIVPYTSLPTLGHFFDVEACNFPVSSLNPFLALFLDRGFLWDSQNC